MYVLAYHVIMVRIIVVSFNIIVRFIKNQMLITKKNNTLNNFVEMFNSLINS